jgi:hypothetical protein
MAPSRRPREYLPTPDEIARSCLALHQANDDPAGEGDVRDVLRERLGLCERERIADDLFENERVGAIERELAESVVGLRWPIAELGLPANLVQALVDMNIVSPRQLATELTEQDFLSLPSLAGQDLGRWVAELKRLGWKFVEVEAGDDDPAPDRALVQADVWRQRIERLASDVSGRKLNDEEDLSHGCHMVGWEAKKKVKDALQAVCPKCDGKRPKRESCRKCKGSGRVGPIARAEAAVEALGFELAARATAKVIRYVEGVRAELAGG